MIGILLLVAAGVCAALAAAGVARERLGWAAVALLAFGLALG
jgi:hypothetical protein